MDTRLLLVKRLLVEASQFALMSDPISSGIAISMLQDAVEHYIWSLIGHKNLKVKDTSPFTTNLEIVQRAGLEVPFVSKLLDLNKARVNFKHYGNLPAVEEAERHKNYVEEFLRVAMPDHFGISYETLSLADLINDEEIRGYLSQAESRMNQENGRKAAVELAKARHCIFAKLTSIIPTVDSALKRADASFMAANNKHSSRPFRYIARYMEVLRESVLVTFLKLPIGEYQSLNMYLPIRGQVCS